jgi:hypothetical protein
MSNIISEGEKRKKRSAKEEKNVRREWWKL